MWPSEARQPVAPTALASGATTISSEAEASQTSRPAACAAAISCITAGFSKSVSGGNGMARATRRFKAAQPMVMAKHSQSGRARR